jgi:GTP-binding protein
MAVAEFRLLATAFTPSQFPSLLGPEIILVGRSNVGKSTLLNRFSGLTPKLQRKLGARVSSRPGCTQSVNFYAWGRLTLVDLPGYGYSEHSQAKRNQTSQLVEQYFLSRPRLALILHLLDVRRSLTALDQQMLAWGRKFGCFYLLVLNKCDKLSRFIQESRRRELQAGLTAGAWQPEIFAVSALTGDGVRILQQRIFSAVEAYQQRS